MTGPFSRTTLWVVIGVTAASLAVAAVLTIVGKDLGGGEPSAGADTFSRSAIGHRGFVELLERLDVPVVKSRSDSAAKATNGLLVVAEPSVSDAAGRDRLRTMVSSSPRTLVVLPKWFGRAKPGAPWVDEVSLVPAAEIDEVLDALLIKAKIARRPPPRRWQGEGVDGAAQPVIGDPQTLDTTEIDPVVDDAEGGLLVGHAIHDDAGPPGSVTRGHEVWVVADPDVLNNHGLAHPGNARFTIALVDRLRAGGPVVIDEVLHGYAQQPSLVRTLFRFPLVLATLQVLICALLAVWAAMVRFGPRRAAPPPIAPGKDFLIRNTASLLHYGGHHGDALRRYLAHSVTAVRAALHAPALAPTALTAWLEHVRTRRGGTVSLVELERDTTTADTPQRTVEVADRVYRWRMEMMDGAHHRS